jgi:capsular exopolysaccharide synthesis family protein
MISNGNHSPDVPHPAASSLVPRTITVEPAAYAGLTRVAAVPAPGTGSRAYWHALRRWWWLAAGLGLLGAAGAAAAAWHFQRPHYTATALLHVAASEQQLVFDAGTAGSLATFEIFKGTQQQLLKSDFVLVAALRDPQVSQLAMVRQQPNPVKWLADELWVDYPGEAEVMRLQLTGEDPQQVTKILSAVVDAYMSEVVNKERTRRQGRLAELEGICQEMDEDLRVKRSHLEQLAKSLGTGDPAALTVKQQITLQHFAEIRKELVRVEFERKRLEGELEAKQAILQSDGSEKIVALNLERLAAADRIMLQLLAMRDALAMVLAEANDRAQPKSAAQYHQGEQSRLEWIEQQLAARRAELGEELRHTKRAELEEQIAELETRIGIAAKQQEQLEKDVASIAQQVEQVGGSSIDIEMKRLEIERLESVLNPVIEERERVKVELRSAPRITPLQQAEAPATPDRTMRLQLAIFAGLLGFGLPVFGIVLLDLRAKRISTSEEVSDGLGLAVLGSVPLVPAGVIRQSRGRSVRHRHWRALLDEAVNGIVVRILCESEEHPMRTFLISSATGGEGKTTLAVQMAMSLARSGRRTLLVDGDLRKPSLDTIFQLRPEPGLSELLLGTQELEDVARLTQVDNLSVVTAGTWMEQGLEILSSGAVANVLAKARQQYEFVVIDGSPILPVSDARLFARHVDGVILSILRDVSQSQKLQATWKILTGLGVRAVGAVVTGSSEASYYQGNDYAARTRQAVAQ